MLGSRNLATSTVRAVHADRKYEFCRNVATYHGHMRPDTSHRHERTLARLADRTRPPTRPLYRTPLQPRDSMTAFERRHLNRAYAREMSQSHDTLAEREREFARWLSWVAGEKKRLYGWKTDQTIERSSIDRATWYRWKKISKPGNMPRPAKLDEFCESLGLDPQSPYQILGWGKPSPKPADLPEPEPDIDLIIRRIETRLAQSPPAAERRELQLKLVRARRARDAQRLADELMAEIDLDDDLREA